MIMMILWGGWGWSSLSGWCAEDIATEDLAIAKFSKLATPEVISSVAIFCQDHDEDDDHNDDEENADEEYDYNDDHYGYDRKRR